MFTTPLLAVLALVGCGSSARIAYVEAVMKELQTEVHRQALSGQGALISCGNPHEARARAGMVAALKGDCGQKLGLRTLRAPGGYWVENGQVKAMIRYEGEVRCMALYDGALAPCEGSPDGQEVAVEAPLMAPEVQASEVPHETLVNGRGVN